MSENIKSTVEELRKLISVDNVIGTPIETEDKILIPVTCSVKKEATQQELVRE